MSDNKKEMKAFLVRLPKDDWLFLKKTAANQEVSMADIVVRCIEKYKRKLENKLTHDDTDV